MITTFNLRPLRRSLSDKANNLLFEAKMKDIKFLKYKGFALPLLLTLLVRENSVLADELIENTLLKDNTLLGAIFENYSLPIIYTTFETVKSGPHILSYIKYKWDETNTTCK